MPSGPYTKGAQNATTIGDAFAYGDVLVGSVAWAAAASSTATVTHGLGTTPDWVVANESGGDAFSITSNSTSVTFVRTATGAGTIYYLIGDLS